MLTIIFGGMCLGPLSKYLHHLKMQGEFSVNRELINVRGLQLPTEYPGPVSKFQSGLPIWKVVESDDWLLLNGPRGTALCPQVLGDFGEANASEAGVTADALRHIAFDFKGKSVALQVLVPRFRTAPAHLAECSGSGFSYDAATGMLNVRGKHVAYLDASQPQAGHP